MIWLIEYSHAYTGEQKVLIVESSQRIDINKLANDLKNAGDIITTIDNSNDVFKAKYVEVLSLDILDRLRESENLLTDVAKSNIDIDKIKAFLGIENDNTAPE